MTAELPRPDRPPGFENDVSFSEALVEYFIREFTDEGDASIDRPQS